MFTNPEYFATDEVPIVLGLIMFRLCCLFSSFFEELINLPKTERDCSEEVNNRVYDNSGEFFVLQCPVCVDYRQYNYGQASESE